MTNNWPTTPEAIALFDKAYAQCAAVGFADDWFFPYDIEADLEDICDQAYLEDGECVPTAWHNYYVARQAAERIAA